MIYLDNAATTRVREAVLERMDYINRECFGNPSSLHTMGIEAERAMEAARSAVGARLFDGGRVCFTSGGTEANNLAILGFMRGLRGTGHLIISETEHKSVLEPSKRLEAEGHRVTRLGVDKNGQISLNELKESIDGGNCLVSLAHVNNETGAILPIEKIYGVVKEQGAVLHLDAVQSFCKLGGRAETDMITVSAHKIGGPKGVGALCVRSGIRLVPLLFGGGQEDNLRSGTQNVAAICGFGAACEDIDTTRELEHVSFLNRALRKRLESGGVIISGEKASPYILNVSFPGVKSEILVHTLEREGIYLSSGAACSSNRPGVSHVILAMGYPRRVAEGCVRISLSGGQTEEEVLFAAERLLCAAGTVGAVMKKSR